MKKDCKPTRNIKVTRSLNTHLCQGLCSTNESPGSCQIRTTCIEFGQVRPHRRESACLKYAWQHTSRLTSQCRAAVIMQIQSREHPYSIQ
jgi:hypothetical protein